MKRLTIFAVSLISTCWLLLPATGRADQDLEVTMEVIDDLAELDGIVSQMPGPGSNDFGEDDDRNLRGDDAGERLGEEGGRPDGFEHDDMDEDDADREMTSEDEFEEDEDVDDDLFDEEDEDLQHDEALEDESAQDDAT